MKDNTVGIVRCDSYDYEFVKQSVTRVLDLIGGLTDVVRPGDRVAFKVNMTGELSPNHGWTTHPNVVRAIAESVLDAGARELFIVEGSGGAPTTLGAMKAFGYDEVAKPLGAKIIDLNSPEPYQEFMLVDVPNGGFIHQRIPFNRILLDSDILISVPKMKCHDCVGITLALKNQVGCTPRTVFERGEMVHGKKQGKVTVADLRYIMPRAVVDINLARRIDFVVVDAVVGRDLGEGDWISGTRAINTNTIIVGRNPVAVDVVGCAAMGFDPEADYPLQPFSRVDNYLKLASESGLGPCKLSEITVKGTPIQEIRQSYRPPSGQTWK
nr:DUF362 domain-containing protein [Desulfobacterales bacterium]